MSDLSSIVVALAAAIRKSIAAGVLSAVAIVLAVLKLVTGAVSSVLSAAERHIVIVLAVVNLAAEVNLFLAAFRVYGGDVLAVLPSIMLVVACPLAAMYVSMITRRKAEETHIISAALAGLMSVVVVEIPGSKSPLVTMAVFAIAYLARQTRRRK